MPYGKWDLVPARPKGAPNRGEATAEPACCAAGRPAGLGAFVASFHRVCTLHEKLLECHCECLPWHLRRLSFYLAVLLAKKYNNNANGTRKCGNRITDSCSHCFSALSQKAQ